MGGAVAQRPAQGLQLEPDPHLVELAHPGHVRHDGKEPAVRSPHHQALHLEA